MSAKKKFNNSNTRDVISLVIICLMNPVWITFIYDTSISFPDSFKYLVEAENIIRHFVFNTGPWGHIDESSILPPVYPAMTALIMLTGIESISSGLLVSQISAFIFSALAYFYLKSVTKRLIALVAVIAIQLTSVYFDYATLILSESLFMMLVLAMLYILGNITSGDLERTRTNLLLLGCLLALIFLTREIGLVFFMATICYLVIAYLRKVYSRSVLHNVLIFTCSGFILLIIPYYLLTYIQTGEPPFTRSYRLNNYVVNASEEDIKKLVGETDSQPSTDYGDIFKSRREMMQLLPDSSEMLVMVQTGNSQQDNNLYQIFLRNMKKYSGNIGNQFVEKLDLLREITGKLVFWIFVFSIFTSLFHKSVLVTNETRMIIPLFAIIYLLSLSIFPANIARYVEILVPFILLHVSMEIFLVARSLQMVNQFSAAFVPDIILSVVIFGIITITTPNLFYRKHIYPVNTQIKQDLQNMRDLIQGDKVFSQFPMPAYYAGGTFMQLPNDEFEKVATYSEKTGIKWLLVLDVPDIRNFMKISEKSYSWILDNLEKEYPDKIDFVYGIHDKSSNSVWKLYKFKS